MTPNREWHEHDVLSPSASTEQKAAWYLRHAANCGCHGIPAAMLRELNSRGIALPHNYELPWMARGTIGEAMAPEVPLIVASSSEAVSRTNL